MSEALELEMLDFVDVPVFVLVPDGNGDIVYAKMNRRGCTGAGYEPEEIVGKTARELYGNPHGDIVYRKHLETFADGKPNLYEVQLPFTMGIRTVRTTLTPMPDDHGNVVRMIGTSVDITDMVAGRVAEADMVSMASEMEQFVNMAAHDLRTPMHNVQLLAEELATDFTDLGDGKGDLIEMLAEVSRTATELISDVLLHAQAMMTEREDTEFDFGELCTDLFLVLDPLKRHELWHDVCILVTDRTALQILLRNLIDNALKHAGRPQVCLTISVAEAEEDGKLVFEVEDNGMGYCGPAFDELTADQMSPAGGFGLLAIRRLVRARGGDIQAVPPLSGAGACIRFTLPGRLHEEHACADQPSPEADRSTG